MDSTELDYLNWNIPRGDRIQLGLYTEQELPTIHEWKHQVDISFLTCHAVKRMSLEERLRQFKQKIPAAFAIRRITDGQFLGGINIYGYNPQNRSVGIGYFTGPPYRQQGYTKEGVLLLLRYLFEVVELNKVMAETGSFNQGSIALLKTIGFQQDGCLRQHQFYEETLHDRLLFSVLAEDWQTLQTVKK